jgi:dTDP-4-dehydrorhamnose reductase
MKVYIIGISGMLGNCLFFNFNNNKKFITRGSIRSKSHRYFDKFKEKIDFNVDVKNFNYLKKKILDFDPDYVINCVGWVKQKKEKIYLSKFINSTFPHKLNKFLKLKKKKLIHFSTDCVFNGKHGDYELTSRPNALDLYGKSKFKGEVNDNNCLTIRTSIIGHEIEGRFGLLEWFLNKKKKCLGFKNVFFTGVTTYTVYNFLIKLMNSKKKIYGIYHLSSKKISKFSLLKKIKNIYRKSTLIKEDKKIIINRSLSNKLSQKKFAFNVPSWEIMIKEMKINKNKIYLNFK